MLLILFDIFAIFTRIYAVILMVATHTTFHSSGVSDLHWGMRVSLRLRSVHVQEKNTGF